MVNPLFDLHMHTDKNGLSFIPGIHSPIRVGKRARNPNGGGLLSMLFAHVSASRERILALARARGSASVESIRQHHFTVRAHPRNRNKLSLFPFVESLHFESAILVLMQFVFHVHKMYTTLEPDKGDRTKERARICDMHMHSLPFGVFLGKNAYGYARSS